MDAEVKQAHIRYLRETVERRTNLLMSVVRFLNAGEMNEARRALLVRLIIEEMGGKI